MTPAEMVTEIQDYGFEDVASARVYALLNQALKQITNSRPWSWRETSATLTFAGSSATYANSITRPVPIAVTNPSTGNTVSPMRSEAWQKMVAANMTDDGEPQWYYFDAGVMKFWPRPAATDTLTMRYLQRQSDVTSASVEADVLLPPDYHWLPILLVVSRLSARDDDVELAQFYMNEYRALFLEMVQDMETRSQYDRPDTVQVVADADDLDYYS